MNAWDSSNSVNDLSFSEIRFVQLRIISRRLIRNIKILFYVIRDLVYESEMFIKYIVR